MHCTPCNNVNNKVYLSGTEAASTYFCLRAYEDESAQLCASGSWSIFCWSETLHILCGIVLPISEMLYVRMSLKEETDRRAEGRRKGEREKEQGERSVNKKTTEPEDVGHPQEISGRPVIEKEAIEENSLSHTKEKWIARGSG